MRNDKEYQLCKAISTYLKLQYPNVLYHFDYAGLNLSIQQASKMKTIQGKIGYPDLFIMNPKNIYAGLFLEIKYSKNQIFDVNNVIKKSKHISEQKDMINMLRHQGYAANFVWSFEMAKDIIDKYLHCKY